jgi:hypothetical protein
LVKTYTIAEADTADTAASEKFDNQLLGLLFDSQKKAVIGCSLKSDINLWTGGAEQPSQTLRGHCDPVIKVVNFNN